MKLIALCLLAMSLALSSANAQPKGNPGKGPKKDLPAVQNENSSVVNTLTDAIFGDDNDNGWKPSKAKNKNKGKNNNQQGLTDYLPDILFGNDERNIISEYFRKNTVATSSLPPGIAKNVARGKPLPPGIAKRGLPNNLMSQLPIRDGWNRFIVGNDVLLVDQKTGTIADVIKDIMSN
ncbi:MAG: hypothetical protein E2O89_07085 [Alphaproteobacteria bacterium]|nr:MAG: hypothetical protein E2O89_07085 [Alphaproteobacteria bacterium]